MSLVTLFKAACQFGMKQYRVTLTSYNTFCRATPRSEQGGLTVVGQVVWSSPFTLYHFIARTVVQMGERTFGLFVPAHSSSSSSHHIIIIIILNHPLDCIMTF